MSGLRKLTRRDVEALLADGRCRFVEMDLSHADLEALSLQGCVFARSRMAHATLRFADLRGASFYQCDLTGADLRDTLLSGSDFTDASAEHARFERARGLTTSTLTRTKLHGATGL